MIRVVIDTSVLVSAVISPTGPNAQVFELIANDRIRPYVTTAVVEEYDRVFEYEHLTHLDKRRVANVRRLLEAAAAKVKSRGRLRISSHEDDNRIYECAVADKASLHRHREHEALQSALQDNQDRKCPATAETAGRSPGLTQAAPRRSPNWFGFSSWHPQCS